MTGPFLALYFPLFLYFLSTGIKGIFRFGLSDVKRLKEPWV